MLTFPKTNTPQSQRSFRQTNRPAVDRRVLSWLPSPQELRRPIEAAIAESMEAYGDFVNDYDGPILVGPLSEADTQHMFLELREDAPSLEELAVQEMEQCMARPA